MTKTYRGTVLIVDDNSTNRTILLDILRGFDFSTLVANNGKTAIKKLETVEPDVILLDVVMPDMSGFDACQHIKQNPKTKDIPIIFTTSLSDPESKVKGFSMGAVDYVTKPFQAEEIVARIELHLKLRSLALELRAKNAQLSHLNASLEKKVEERTDQLKKAQSRLVLSEKMSSLGQLSAGVAHEINNPLSFIIGNLSHAREHVLGLTRIVELYRKYYPEPAEEIVEESEAIELEYILEDLPQILESMEQGTSRIAQISRSMRTFSRADRDAKVLFDLHEGIDSTLLLLKHRLKGDRDCPTVEVNQHYGNLPSICCYPSQINQVFMNLLANALDALEESYKDISESGKGRPRRIDIYTEIDERNERAIVRIVDNGPGIPKEVRERIFDHAFTTKAVGKGTGLGLAIVRQIVEEKHGGTIECISQPGEGAEFVVKIPVR